MDRREMFLAVNPVFATAKGCLALLSHTGIKEAAQLAEEIDLTVKGSMKTPPEISRVYMISNEARYHIGNILAGESGCDVIVDLPCGYVPRGLAIADMKKTFYGFDLPAVIEELEPAIRRIATKEQLKYLNYKAVDATNYDSMKSALSDVKGKICILMDGLLGYFNEPELDSVCKNISRLLKEFGGCWITADKFSVESTVVTFNTLTGADGEMIKSMMLKGGAKVANIAQNHTVIQEGTPEEAKKFFSGYGFDIREISYADKVPDLLCLKDSPEDMSKLREAYKNIPIWIMTVNKERISDEIKGRDFKAEIRVEGSRLICELAGRLDTITAPELLTGFNDKRTDDIKEITIDMAETEYVSSAGLRVLLSMCKTLSGKENFHIINYSDSIKDILEVTGFDQLFGMA